MTIIDIIFFLPAIACAYWTVIFFMNKRTPRQTIMAGCSTVCVAYFVTYAFLTMPDTDYKFLCSIDIIGVPLALLSLAMMSIYINLFITKRPPTIPHMAMLIPGLMYTSALGVLYYIIGRDGIMKITWAIDHDLPISKYLESRVYTAFYFVDQELTMYIALGLFVLLAMLCIWVNIKEGYRFKCLIDFFFFGKRIAPAVLISSAFIMLMLLMLPVALNYHVELQKHPVVSGALATAIASTIMLICLAEHHSDIKDFTLRNIINSKEYYAKQLEEARVAEFARAEELKEELDDNERSYKERRHKELIYHFRKLMEADRIYLDPDINIIQVAEKLNIGRTMLSTLINKNFGKNFRTLINEYRIEYSKKFMAENLSLTQEQIAFKCGFNDASAFSHKFKEIVGMPPLAWSSAHVARQDSADETAAAD